MSRPNWSIVCCLHACACPLRCLGGNDLRAQQSIPLYQTIKRESTHSGWMVSKSSANMHPTPAGDCLQHLGPSFNREMKSTDCSCCIQNCEVEQHYNLETATKQTHSSQGFCVCDSLHMAVKFGFKRKFHADFLSVSVSSIRQLAVYKTRGRRDLPCTHTQKHNLCILKDS